MASRPDPIPLLERLGRLLHNDAHREGLKPTQWEALRYLSRANRFSRSPSAVTAYLGVTKGTVSQTLAALERKGLIAKAVVANDRRNVRIKLTRKGTALLNRDPLADLENAMKALGPQRAARLGNGLQDLLQIALQRRDGRPFGACRTCRYFQRNAKEGKPHRCALLHEPLSEADGDMICVEQQPA